MTYFSTRFYLEFLHMFTHNDKSISCVRTLFTYLSMLAFRWQIKRLNVNITLIPVVIWMAGKDQNSPRRVRFFEETRDKTSVQVRTKSRPKPPNQMLKSLTWVRIH